MAVIYPYLLRFKRSTKSPESFYLRKGNATIDGYAIGIDYLNKKYFRSTYRIEVWKDETVFDEKIVSLDVNTGFVNFSFYVPNSDKYYLRFVAIKHTPNPYSYIVGEGAINQ